MKLPARNSGAVYHQQAVEDTFTRALADLLHSGACADPLLQWITVTRTAVSPDKSVAKVYVANDLLALNEPELFASEVDELAIAVLEKAKNHLKRVLGKELNWRKTPELSFYIDQGLTKAAQINELLG